MRGATGAGMYFLPFDHYTVTPTPLQTLMMLEEHEMLFHCLDGLVPSPHKPLAAGAHLFCVYGNNFFKKASFFIEAVIGEPASAATSDIKQSEEELIQLREELQAFAPEYDRVRKAFLEAQAKYQAQAVKLQSATEKRRNAYDSWGAKAVPLAAPTPSIASSVATGLSSAKDGLFKLFGAK
eukprot:TRINITY_DN5233_c0_g1_i4.p2 TRINITY_DN5233_c0_g1~~TRINITY_DN5233_c0_g1_i4.p2  ORF type:complete len:181 (+),score=46.83 TRINITY_DN5233_c0_g1_i4:701-1243(+)